MKPGDQIKITLCWCSHIGKVVGVFDAIIVKEIEYDKIAEIQIRELETVVASNPRISGEIKREQIEEDIDAFKRRPMRILKECARGAPLCRKSSWERK